ncbi:ofd1 [Symbiodinium natans]|uniref:Ofd1 protein n=1 Tax=Symbiodinium natans TaxID=878477 RepID=A0A812GAD9_9DINO|nr:ofd1 [Symbiodinium natans]
MLEREQIALEEAAKSRAEVQEALAKAKRELSDREERLRQRERLATERTRAKELDLEKKAVQWRANAQQVIDEEQMRQSTRAKHLDVEDKRLQMLKEGLDRREQEVRLAEERNSAAAAELTRRAEETRESAKAAAQAAVAAEREELRQAQFSLEREKVQMAGIRDHQEALKDRLVAETAEAERSANQARKDARAAEEGCSAKARELEDAREQIQLLKVAGQQVVAFQQELESLRTEKTALRHMFETEKQAHSRAESDLGQLQKDKTRLCSEVDAAPEIEDKSTDKLLAAESAPTALARQLQETRSRLSTEASETERLRQQLQVAEQKAAPQKMWVSALQNLEQEIFSGFSPDMEVGKAESFFFLFPARRSRALEERTLQLEREISAFEQRHRREP